MSLNAKLQSALDSRQRREILRRLPSPTRAPASGHDDLVDFCSNDYLSLASYGPLREKFIAKLQAAPDVLGSGGSRLLVNGSAHHALEARLAAFFRAPAALLFNSGFDANVGFFTCVPQAGDAVVYDEYIHASVHDGVRASRAHGPGAHRAFAHNSVASLRDVLLDLLKSWPGLRAGVSSVIVAVETLYSMDGTFAPLEDIVGLVEVLFPRGNGYVVVDEAHATGLFGEQGRGLTAFLGFEDRVFARLHTFGKALASSGAVILTSPLVKQYLLNYARSLIYTTSMNYANIIAIDCSIDVLEDGTAAKLARDLSELVRYALAMLRQSLPSLPSDLVSLPQHLDVLNLDQDERRAPIGSLTRGLMSPILPIMTAHPRPLSAHLRHLGLNARPITWPTVPKGKDRVRVCLHAGNSRRDVERLVCGIVEWAERMVDERAKSVRRGKERAVAILLEAKL